MRSQKELWIEEHKDPRFLVRVHADKPSGPIPGFVDFLKEKQLNPEQTKIFDAGCGKGRNSIYLADNGFKVVGGDFAPKAVIDAKAKVGEQKNLEFREMDLGEPWGFEKEFDAVIDCDTSICLPNPEREQMIQSAHEALKSGGYYLFYGVARTELVNTNPGPEPNSVIFPETGKFEKQYTKEELIEVFARYGFHLINLVEPTGSDVVEGKQTTFPMWVAIFQK
ncbi:hypothetical protein A2363_03995 [Candidatus Gottesmanbacteria bacterium RIFOXYB1_FULL_47_11]|uniref:Methyltransferase domain-containing protein n=1 Tax=Candidatus Gottesmanbacteria bacterium RIFOXYB1_FULL_47_11 TaxID=1798401 RepID=A0A1F6BCP8_9BACT|nr:MAG: hypothetical protein A2363_03995 [Candidatus Gottesmanbacteria bacterium RIFOXYB1_FULL_47_11]